MSSNTQAAIEVTAQAAASKVTYTGGTATIAGWLIQVDWLTVAGFFIAIAGFIVNVYFQSKRHKREELESLLRTQREQDIHEIEMKKRKEECNAKQD